MKIGTRLIVGFLAITALIWVTFLFAVNTYTKVGQKFEVLAEHVIPHAILLSEMEKAAGDVNHQSMEYMLYGEEVDRERVLSAVKHLEGTGERLALEHVEDTEGIGQTGEEAQVANRELLAKIGMLNSAAVEIVALKSQGISTDELLTRDRETIHPAFIAVVDLLEEHRAHHDEELAVAEKAVTEAHTAGMKILLLTAGFVTLLAALIALFMTKSIVHPLRALHKGTEMIGQGNLDYKVGTGAKDEIGQLSRAFDRMTEDLKETTASIDRLNKEITERKQAEHSLGERIKELNCLYGISSIAERPGVTLDEVYQEVTNVIPPGWQYPDITCARITFGDKEFRTDNFKTAEWMQSANINVRGQKKGTVEVTYLEERPEIDEGPFMKEERLLINAVAERLGKIAEHKQAEEKLRESEERYRALINLGSEIGEAVVMLQDTEQGEAIQTFVSDEWSRITGYSREELLGMPVFDLLNPKDRRASIERHRRKMRGETLPGLFEMSVIRKNGTEVPIELTSTYTTYMGKRANVAYIRDITERKQAEEKLR